ncbi:unnamed protein product [Notodromas monacha]|uniref:Uncharacterized protein n=1 Tax=Notodromas monacha TaxID=399045 RepID=A0A7R9BK26_9CRUS|nr:unnamed protein product [Notodromas monacha]CAG0915561.1 unnamed protein product [Notodromas monacha]
MSDVDSVFRGSVVDNEASKRTSGAFTAVLVLIQDDDHEDSEAPKRAWWSANLSRMQADARALLLLAACGLCKLSITRSFSVSRFCSNQSPSRENSSSSFVVLSWRFSGRLGIAKERDPVIRTGDRTVFLDLVKVFLVFVLSFSTKGFVSEFTKGLIRVPLGVKYSWFVTRRHFIFAAAEAESGGFCR